MWLGSLKHFFACNFLRSLGHIPLSSICLLNPTSIKGADKGLPPKPFAFEDKGYKTACKKWPNFGITDYIDTQFPKIRNMALTVAHFSG